MYGLMKCGPSKCWLSTGNRDCNMLCSSTLGFASYELNQPYFLRFPHTGLYMEYTLRALSLSSVSGLLSRPLPH